MARNAEKAMTTLARWRQAQVILDGKEKERRPYLATECDDLKKAIKWRVEIIREVSKKVAQIQNAGLGEFRIRDLNDEINKLLREKRHWEIRIIDLGGPNFLRYGPKMLDHEGKEVPGNRGYKYFGAAKDLPGVRELFEREPPPPPRKTRAELMRDVDTFYYGFRDDDDGVLIPLEQEAERKAVAKAVTEWQEKKLNPESGVEEMDTEPSTSAAADSRVLFRTQLDDDDKSEHSDSDGELTTDQRFAAHVPVPSQKDIEEALVKRKKQELLEKYVSETLVQQSAEAKTLLGYDNS